MNLRSSDRLGNCMEFYYAGDFWGLEVGGRKHGFSVHTAGLRRCGGSAVAVLCLDAGTPNNTPIYHACPASDLLPTLRYPLPRSLFSCLGVRVCQLLVALSTALSNCWCCCCLFCCLYVHKYTRPFEGNFKSRLVCVSIPSRSLYFRPYRTNRQQIRVLIFCPLR